MSGSHKCFSSVSGRSQPQLAFMWGGSQFTFIEQPHSSQNSPAYCRMLVKRDLDLMQGLSGIKHDVDIMIVSETEEQVGTDKLMLIQVTNRVCLRNQQRSKGPPTCQNS